MSLLACHFLANESLTLKIYFKFRIQWYITCQGFFVGKRASPFPKLQHLVKSKLILKILVKNKKMKKYLFPDLRIVLIPKKIYSVRISHDTTHLATSSKAVNQPNFTLSIMKVVGKFEDT